MRLKVAGKDTAADKARVCAHAVGVLPQFGSVTFRRHVAQPSTILLTYRGIPNEHIHATLANHNRYLPRAFERASCPPTKVFRWPFVRPIFVTDERAAVALD